jgi:aminopeptidase N
MKKILLPLSNLFCATALGAIPVILILILATPSQAQSDSTGSLDVPAIEHYKLVLEIDPEHHSLSGQTDISIKNSGQHALKVVPILLYRLMELQAASDAKGVALPFTQNVVKFPDNPAWQVNAIQVTLPAPLAPGQSTTIDLKYAGMLFGYREVMAYVRETISEDYSLLRAESMPYPIIAAPSYAGWRKSYENKFDYQIEATVPAGFVAVCPGNQIGDAQTQAGKITYRCAGPPESNSINLAIAKFRVLEDSQRNLRVYALAGELEAGNRIMNEMRRSLDFYTSYFGPPPEIGTIGVHNGLTVIEIPDGWGSYALRGYIFQSAAAFKDPKRVGELYHEVGHVWNAMVANRIQRTRYFDEAFAAYFETLAVRQFEGEQTYRKLLDEYRDTYIERVNRDPLGKTTPIVDYGKYEVGVFSYSKGAWSLYVLHQLLGDDQFKQIIHTFLSQFGDKPADFKDFQRVAEAVSHRDLGKYFNEWIFGSQSSQLLLERVPIDQIIQRY